MNLTSTIEIFAGGPGSGCRGDDCGRKETAEDNQQILREKFEWLKKSLASRPRVQRMTPDTWISKDGTATKVRQLESRHLTSILRQLHEQLALARGEVQRTGQDRMYENRVGTDGPVIERAIPPYRAMVQEARKRGLHW